MLDIKFASVLLFLVPGLCAYCALYGVFGHTHLRLAGFTHDTGRAQQRAFAPTPPPTTSVKAATIIVLASLVGHLITATLAWLVDRDIYAIAYDAFDGQPRSHEVIPLLLVSIAQGVVIYLVIRAVLKRLSAANRLPVWLYGWTAYLANLLDEDDKIVLCVILSDIDVEMPATTHAAAPASTDPAPLASTDAAPAATTAKTMAVIYTGIVQDLMIAADGAVRRVNLVECQRSLIDLTQPIDIVVPQPLAQFSQMSIEADRIRNVTFEIGRAIAPPAGVDDRLAAALARLYAATSPSPPAGAGPRSPPAP